MYLYLYINLKFSYVNINLYIHIYKYVYIQTYIICINDLDSNVNLLIYELILLHFFSAKTIFICKFSEANICFPI